MQPRLVILIVVFSLALVGILIALFYHFFSSSSSPKKGNKGNSESGNTDTLLQQSKDDDGKPPPKETNPQKSKDDSSEEEEPNFDFDDPVFQEKELDYLNKKKLVKRKKPLRPFFATEDQKKDMDYDDLLREYIINPDPELLTRLESAHEESCMPGRRNAPIEGAEPVSLTDTLQELEKWKPLITFANDDLPNDQVLNLMKDASRDKNSLKSLPLPFFLKFNLRDKQFIGILEKLISSKVHGIVNINLMAADFKNHYAHPPPPVIKLMNQILDVNWKARAKRAISLFKDNREMFQSRFSSEERLVEYELDHAIDMIVPHSSNPATHIDRELFEDVYNAFKAFRKANMTPNLSHRSFSLFPYASLKLSLEQFVNIILNEICELLGERENVSLERFK